MDNCIFCKIVKGEIPCYKVWEDENFLAFLTIQPINRGHTLFIPKTHVDYIFDVKDSLLSDMLVKAKPVAKKIVSALKPKTGRVGIMVAGLEVPHAHLHLIPMNNERELDFSQAKDTSPEELKAVLEKLASSG
jgi:histidine triad (HIT) family protein